DRSGSAPPALARDREDQLLMLAPVEVAPFFLRDPNQLEPKLLMQRDRAVVPRRPVAPQPLPTLLLERDPQQLDRGRLAEPATPVLGLADHQPTVLAFEIILAALEPSEADRLLAQHQRE